MLREEAGRRVQSASSIPMPKAAMKASTTVTAKIQVYSSAHHRSSVISTSPDHELYNEHHSMHLGRTGMVRHGFAQKIIRISSDQCRGLESQQRTEVRHGCRAAQAPMLSVQRRAQSSTAALCVSSLASQPAGVHTKESSTTQQSITLRECDTAPVAGVVAVPSGLLSVKSQTAPISRQ
jgi:hypothetical protein